MTTMPTANRAVPMLASWLVASFLLALPHPAAAQTDDFFKGKTVRVIV